MRVTGDEIWFERALDLLRHQTREADQRLRTFFSATAPLYIARAPGRLDVMGGIADYSGSLVLELPLECATTAILQPQSTALCELATRRGGRWEFFSIDLARLVRDGDLSAPAALAEWFAKRHGRRWASYVVGVLQCFMQRAAREGYAAPTGVRLVIDSEIPAGRGVASSAALEVAVALVISASCGSAVPATELATLCQAVENNVVGAPCGIMDQMTSASGRQNSLLRLLCQPGTVEGHVAIPEGYRFYGIDSGISHAVSGADYGTVRTAAFMGYRMIAARAGLKVSRENSRVRIDDARWRGYLANLTEFELAELAQGLPRQMSGAKFIAQYDGITDAVTTVRPRRRYPVLAATEHPVREHARVRQFADLLASLAERPDAPQQMGRLMYESHRSYGACGLGSDGTDRLVELVAAIGSARGLFGAKITGGGSGGTVAVFGTTDAEPLVHDVASRYAVETSRRATVFARSGPGAAQIGVLRLESVSEALSAT
jgi:L-arabinokinase